MHRHIREKDECGYELTKIFLAVEDPVEKYLDHIGVYYTDRRISDEELCRTIYDIDILKSCSLKI
jgi:hypothetical protein